MSYDFVWTVLTSATVSSLLTAFVVWMVREWLSERLKNAIKHEYDVRLESHKAVMQAESATELERLRSDLSIAAAHQLEEFRYAVDAQLDRATKLHEREFEVLPEVWSRLAEAFWTARSVMARFQSLPDINAMSAPHVEDFIQSLDFPDWVKDELRSASDKAAVYRDRIFYYRLDSAKNKARDAYTYLVKTGVFLSQELRQKFESIHKLLYEAITEHETVEESRRGGDRWRPDDSKCERLRRDGETLMNELEAAVRSRLRITAENSAPITAQRQ